MMRWTVPMLCVPIGLEQELLVTTPDGSDHTVAEGYAQALVDQLRGVRQIGPTMNEYWVLVVGTATELS